MEVIVVVVVKISPPAIIMWINAGQKQDDHSWPGTVEVETEENVLDGLVEANDSQSRESPNDEAVERTIEVDVLVTCHSRLVISCNFR